MHLTDIELVEPNEAQRLHLASCEECQRKLHQLRQLKLELQTLPSFSPSDELLVEVKQRLATRQTTHPSRIRFRVTMAIAASFMIAVTTFFYQFKVDAEQIDRLIAQSKALEQDIKNQRQTFQLASINDGELLIELNEIDIAIQRAYFRDESKERKIELWAQRVAILRKIIEQRNVMTLRV